MTKPRVACFGILNNVFPLGKEGLREVVPSCFDCSDRVACLKEALNTEQGLIFRSEVINRYTSRGLAGWLRRWSEKKDINRRLKQKRGEKR